MTDVSKAPFAPDWLAGRRKPFCLLCGKPTSFVNIYLPGPNSPVAHPRGGVRFIIYSLCKRCAEQLHELAPLIEARIEEDFGQPELN